MPVEPPMSNGLWAEQLPAVRTGETCPCL